jgi:hypothetical protein
MMKRGGTLEFVSLLEQGGTDSVSAQVPILCNTTGSVTAPVSKLQRELAKLNTSYNQTSVVSPAEEEKENEEEIVYENEEDHDIKEDSIQAHFV